MQQFTDVQFCTSDQHKDLTKTRQERDVWDTEKLIVFLSSRPPFSTASTLHCIDTGVCAEEVNADAAVPTGKKILASMEGKNVQEYVFRKHNQVITTDKKSQVQVGKNSVEIDPQLLFQRLVTAGLNCGELHEVFTHELCSYPPALFHTSDALLEADKPVLANALWKEIGNTEVTLPEDFSYVLDGGALLHRVSWKAGKTWHDIALSFWYYVWKKIWQSLHCIRWISIWANYQTVHTASETKRCYWSCGKFHPRYGVHCDQRQVSGEPHQ